MKYKFVICLFIFLSLSCIKCQAKEPVRILSIGNSHARDSFRYLSKILDNADYNAIVGIAFIKGSNISDHCINYASNKAAYNYWIYTNGKVQKFENISLNDICHKMQWDYIIIQPSLEDAVNENNGVSRLIDYIDTQAKIGYFIPWSYSYGYKDMNTYKYYSQIQKTSKKILLDEKRILWRLNAGYAIKLARRDEFLGRIGNGLLRGDKTHLTHGVAMFYVSYYISGYFGIRSNDVNWVPTKKYDKYITTECNRFLINRAKEIIDDIYD